MDNNGGNLQGDSKSKFYQRSWFLWITLILFAPVGIFVLWKYHGDKKKNTKIILSVVFAALFVVEVAAAGGSGGTEPTVAESPNKIESISAMYYGSMERGAVIDNNADITVTATYSDGTTEDVDGWEIATPVTLEAGITSDVVISYDGLEYTLSLTCTDLTPEQYKERCQSISYEELARNEETYKYEYVYFEGQVIQVQESGSDVAMRVNVTPTDYGIWDDTVMVFYSYDEGESRILEDDIITFYGYYDGLYSYTSVLGAEITVPSVYARYIDLQ